MFACVAPDRGQNPPEGIAVMCRGAGLEQSTDRIITDFEIRRFGCAARERYHWCTTSKDAAGYIGMCVYPWRVPRPRATSSRPSDPVPRGDASPCPPPAPPGLPGAPRRCRRDTRPARVGLEDRGRGVRGTGTLATGRIVRGCFAGVTQQGGEAGVAEHIAHGITHVPPGLRVRGEGTPRSRGRRAEECRARA